MWWFVGYKDSNVKVTDIEYVSGFPGYVITHFYCFTCNKKQSSKDYLNQRTDKWCENCRAIERAEFEKSKTEKYRLTHLGVVKGDVTVLDIGYDRRVILITSKGRMTLEEFNNLKIPRKPAAQLSDEQRKHKEIYNKVKRRYQISEQWEDFLVFFNDTKVSKVNGYTILPIDDSKPIGKDNFAWYPPGSMTENEFNKRFNAIFGPAFKLVHRAMLEKKFVIECSNGHQTVRSNAKLYGKTKGICTTCLKKSKKKEEKAQKILECKKKKEESKKREEEKKLKQLAKKQVFHKKLKERFNNRIVALEYSGYRKPAKFKCSCGNIFTRKEAGDILHKQHGCNACAKSTLDYDAPTKMYYVRIKYENTHFYKVGITQTEVIKRFERECKKSDLAIIKVWKYATGWEAYKTEKNIVETYKSELLCNGEKPLKKTGISEIFYTDVLGLDNERHIQCDRIDPPATIGKEIEESGALFRQSEAHPTRLAEACAG